MRIPLGHDLRMIFGSDVCSDMRRRLLLVVALIVIHPTHYSIHKITKRHDDEDQR